MEYYRYSGQPIGLHNSVKNNNDLYCVLLNAVLGESEGELEVFLPLRRTARNKKKGVCIHNYK